MSQPRTTRDWWQRRFTMRTLIRVLLPVVLVLAVFVGTRGLGLIDLYYPAPSEAPPGTQIGIPHDDPAFCDYEDSLSVDTALGILKKTELFSSPAIGDPPAASNQGRAFRVLRDRADAIELFLEISREGSVVGKLYALIGLYSLDRESFDLEVGEFTPSQDNVWTQIGCVSSPMEVSEIVSWIRKGKLFGFENYVVR